jgi:hypothetical protein
MKRLRWGLAIVFLLAGVVFVALRRDRAIVADPSRASRPTVNSDRTSGTDLDEAAASVRTVSDADRNAITDPTRRVRVGGVVIDLAPDARKNGALARGVEVTLSPGEEDSKQVRTGEDGRFAFELADPGSRPLQFTILAKGSSSLRQASQSVVIDEGRQDALDLVLRRYPKGDLSGITVDAQDHPLPGVHLSVRFQETTRETDSDSQGEFRIPDADWFVGIDAKLPGYALLSSFSPNQIKEGGWEPMRVVLAPATSLVVHVVDGSGQGIADLPISVELEEWERKLPKRFPVTREFRNQPGARTREDGRAAIEEVWTGHRLSLRIDEGGERTGRPLGTFDRELDGRLVRSSAEEGRPIVLATAEIRELTAILEKGPVVRGLVVDELSKPVTDAFVRLEGDWNAATRSHPKVEGRSDEAGRFALEIPPSRGSKYRVTASDREPHEFDGEAARTASLLLDLSSGLPPDLVLVLRAGSKIAGHVLSEDGSTVPARIFAFAGPDSAAVGPWGTYADAGKGGAFTIANLEPGAYDLWVRPVDAHAEVRMHDVRAGREDVELRVPSVRPVHLTVDVGARDGEPGQIILLVARSWSDRKGASEIASLPTESVYSEPRGWPPSVPCAGSGIGGFEDGRGVASFELTPAKENPTRIDIDEGLYWLGARGSDRDGEPLFPVGTGLVRVTAGEIHVRFELAPAVRVEGRLVDTDARDLAVGIARRGGDLLDLDVGSRALLPSRPVSGDGSFFFAAVPVGENEIWIGTASELAAGKPSRRQPLTVGAKGVPFLEIAMR